MWGKKKPVTEPVEIPDDVREARSMRVQASLEQREAENQGPAIARLTTYLRSRRESNHFGDSIQITYTRRGHA